MPGLSRTMTVSLKDLFLRLLQPLCNGTKMTRNQISDATWRGKAPCTDFNSEISKTGWHVCFSTMRCICDQETMWAILCSVRECSVWHLLKVIASLNKYVLQRKEFRTHLWRAWILRSNHLSTRYSNCSSVSSANSPLLVCNKTGRHAYKYRQIKKGSINCMFLG